MMLVVVVVVTQMGVGGIEVEAGPEILAAQNLMQVVERLRAAWIRGHRLVSDCTRKLQESEVRGTGDTDWWHQK